MFSALVRLNRARMQPADYKCQLQEAIEHVKFALSLYKLQAREGRYYLHEHPAGASSWCLPEVMRFIADNDALLVTSHLCQYGLLTTDASGNPAPALKPTRWMTNSLLGSRAWSKM